MWAIQNQTPYAAERSWIRDKTGAHHWVVAVKATFQIGPDGRTDLAPEQPAPLLAPEFFGEPGLSSVKYEADVGPTKPTTDVLVLGNAHAPNGRPTTKLAVGMQVDETKKAVVVHGPRTYRRTTNGVTTSDPEPFVTCALRYEDAYGGSDLADPDPRRQRIDPRNPVGKGLVADPSRLHGAPAHRIEYADGEPATRGPAGFGPLASYWSPRRELAGTYDDAWAKDKKPLLPDDYDERFVLSAPADQRPPRWLVGGEQVSLFHMTPEDVLRFRLPRIFLTYSTRFGRKRQEHRGHLATVIVEVEERLLTLVWRTSLVVAPTRSEYLDETTIDQKPYVR
jgi:hypothetical protein